VFLSWCAPNGPEQAASGYGRPRAAGTLSPCGGGPGGRDLEEASHVVARAPQHEAATALGEIAIGGDDHAKARGIDEPEAGEDQHHVGGAVVDQTVDLVGEHRSGVGIELTLQGERRRGALSMYFDGQGLFELR
jgi:hypothetical protein